MLSNVLDRNYDPSQKVFVYVNFMRSDEHVKKKLEESTLMFVISGSRSSDNKWKTF